MSPLVFGLPQGSEIVILIIVALLIFGGSRIAGLGKSAGRAIREFKEETQSLKAGEPLPRDGVQRDDIAEGEIVDEKRDKQV